MKSARQLAWAGEINVQIFIDGNLLIGESNSLEKPLLNLRFPREAFLPMYLPQILNQLRLYLKYDVNKMIPHCWFSFRETVLPWFLPVSVIFDMTMTEEIIVRSKDNLGIPKGSIISSWPITLHCNYTEGGEGGSTDSKPTPNGFIPLISGESQIESFWMHRWKQACFIMNGSSKLMMSLTRHESVSFWRSIVDRDSDTFSKISAKVIPSNTSGFKMVPIKFHVIYNNSDKFDSPIQPVVKLLQDDNKYLTTLNDVLINTFPKVIDSQGNITGKLIAQGILIRGEETIHELFTSLMSIDGFLHIILYHV